MLDLAFHRGLLSGQHYARSVLSPAHTCKRPKNPYWCPIRAFTWRIAFSLGSYDVLNRGG
jgi:hypothetical protein